MKRRRRMYFSAAQRSEIWDRWQAGESMKSIGRLFDRGSSSIFSVISPAGGIRPAERRRTPKALSLSEREEISRGLSTQCSLRSIARTLGRSPSTISREVRRNGGLDCYRAARSDQAAWDRSLRPRLAMFPWPAQYLPSCSGNGRQSRLLAGSSVLTQGSHSNRCRTKRSIAACTFRPAGC